MAPASARASAASLIRAATSGVTPSAPASSAITPTRRPSTCAAQVFPCPGAVRGQTGGIRFVMARIVSRARAASATVVANGPIWSRELAKAIRPYRETIP